MKLLLVTFSPPSYIYLENDYCKVKKKVVWFDIKNTLNYKYSCSLFIYLIKNLFLANGTICVVATLINLSSIFGLDLLFLPFPQVYGLCRELPLNSLECELEHKEEILWLELQLVKSTRKTTNLLESWTLTNGNWIIVLVTSYLKTNTAILNLWPSKGCIRFYLSYERY